MAKRLALIGGKYGVCDRARQLGADIVLIQKPELFHPGAHQLCEKALYTDYETDESLIPVLRALHEDRPFDALISITEPGLLPAAVAGEALGLPGMLPSAVVRRTLDKFAMRNHLESVGFPPVAAALGESPQDVVRFAKAAGYPVIVKPRDGTGSMGVVRIDGADEAQRVAGRGSFLMEEFLDGPEVSVEAFSFAGRHRVFAVTAKVVNRISRDNPYVEIGHQLPAALDSSLEAELTAYVSAFLDAMEITDGPTHTEVMLTPKGMRIVETHTRVGGDYITGLVRLTTGHDLFSLTLGWPLRLLEEPPGEIVHRGAAAIRYFTPEPGVVREISGIELWRQAPDIHALELTITPGGRIRPITYSEDRVGYVVATGPDLEAAIALCEQTIGAVRIVVEPAGPG